MTDNRLLRLRSAMNKKRPSFKRENYFRLKRLQTGWRRPKGIDSKMRHKLKGKRKSPGTGYRNPRAVRGLHPSGKEIISVANLAELELVESETQVAQIRSSVGSRKRMLMISYAEENGIHILNPQVRYEAGFDDEVDDDVFEDLDLIDDDDILSDDEDDILSDDEDDILSDEEDDE